MAKNGEILETDPEELEIGEDSKTVYVNENDGRYSFNTIAFDVDNSIEEITDEDIE
jgi:hypothetical protein